MTAKKMTPEKLRGVARKLLAKRYDPKSRRHVVVASAILTRAGNIYTGINIRTTQPDLSSCAEMMAVGAAHAAEENVIVDMVVVVRGSTGYVVSPCGRCREYIYDYGTPDTMVAIPCDGGADDAYKMVPVKELLPSKYEKKHD
ncbi:MAG: cytidine deaminase [Lactobacillales bacterium]|jgi:cytidine deaminase|nr:cytidine deaminase [Lactobacillales bacterium]